jgi:hypothetical protein
MLGLLPFQGAASLSNQYTGRCPGLRANFALSGRKPTKQFFARLNKLKQVIELTLLLHRNNNICNKIKPFKGNVLLPQFDDLLRLVELCEKLLSVQQRSCVTYCFNMFLVVLSCFFRWRKQISDAEPPSIFHFSFLIFPSPIALNSIYSPWRG